jgi:hypothetical protein
MKHEHHNTDYMETVSKEMQIAFTLTAGGERETETCTYRGNI